MHVGTRSIGTASPCFVIAEAGVNHDGDPETAARLVDAAATTGANAVKFQTFAARRVVSDPAPKADYQRTTTDPHESQQEMLRRLELPHACYRALKARAERAGLVFLSTPFDEPSADLLEQIGVVAFKVGSGELTHTAFLEHLAQKAKPMVLSTGMATLAEVDAAVRTVRQAGLSSLALLHCVSCYPASPEDVNLRALDTMRSAFGVPVGYSDHTLGTSIALAAVARGAAIVEKHFTLSRSQSGPDHAASLEPDEFAAMVRGIRDVERALGTPQKHPTSSERGNRQALRRSLILAQDVEPGGRIVAQAVTAVRPGDGVSPTHYHDVVGRKATRHLRKGHPLAWGDWE